MTEEDIEALAKSVWSAGDTYIGPSFRSLAEFARKIEIIVSSEMSDWYEAKLREKGKIDNEQNA